MGHRKDFGDPLKHESNDLSLKYESNDLSKNGILSQTH